MLKDNSSSGHILEKSNKIARFVLGQKIYYHTDEKVGRKVKKKLIKYV